jgi:hypothetical protein
MPATVVIMPMQDVGASVREQANLAREQAQMMRDQAQAMRDAARAARDAARANQGTLVPPPLPISRRQEQMFFVGFLVVVMAAVAILRPIMVALGRRFERGPRHDELASPASAARLERIEQAVEAMAVEIERISEGQRFTTRLLTSRPAAELPLQRQD